MFNSCPSATAIAAMCSKFISMSCRAVSVMETVRVVLHLASGELHPIVLDSSCLAYSNFLRAGKEHRKFCLSVSLSVSVCVCLSVCQTRSPKPTRKQATRNQTCSDGSWMYACMRQLCRSEEHSSPRRCEGDPTTTHRPRANDTNTPRFMFRCVELLANRHQ